MKLPNFRRLIKSDYKEDFQELVETLSFSLNNGIEVLYQVLNKSVSLKDNVACTVKELEVSVDSTGTPKSRLSFSLDTANKVLGVVVLNVINVKNPSILPTSGVFVSFSQESRSVIVNNIKGLPADQTFLLTVVAFDT